MRRVIYRTHPSKTIGITLAAVFTASAIFCAGFIFNPSGNNSSIESQAMESTDKHFAAEQKETTAILEIVEPDDTTLNQEKCISNISASKQSNLERAIDDLIDLTESDG